MFDFVLPCVLFAKMWQLLNNSQLFPSRKHQKTSTTLTQISLRKSPPSHPSTTLWSLPSTRMSFVTSPSPRLNCCRAKSLLIDPPPVVLHSHSSQCLWLCLKHLPVYVQYDAVTFPRDMRVQSAEESAKHMLDKNWSCTSWTLKHSCNSRKSGVWSALNDINFDCWDTSMKVLKLCIWHVGML